MKWWTLDAILDAILDVFLDTILAAIYKLLILYTRFSSIQF
jgi:hypothetical protein